MPIWDYPEPNDEEEDRYKMSTREYDPDEAYEEYRRRRDGLED